MIAIIMPKIFCIEEVEKTVKNDSSKDLLHLLKRYSIYQHVSEDFSKENNHYREVISLIEKELLERIK